MFPSTKPVRELIEFLTIGATPRYLRIALLFEWKVTD